MTRSADDPRSLIRYGVAMTALAVVILTCGYLARDALLLVYISVILAIGFSPIVRLIERQKVLPVGSARFPRWLAILVLYVVLIGAIVGVAAVILPEMVRQGRALWTAAPDISDRVQHMLSEHGLLHQPITVRDLLARAPSADGATVGRVASAAKGLAGGIFGIFTILILTLYILVEADSLRAAVLRLFPSDSCDRVESVSRDVTVKVSAWLTGQFVLSAIVGTVSGVGLWVIGIPFFYVLGLISAVGEFIPIVGPILSAVPALAVALTISTQKTLLVLIFFVVQHQLENHVLVPRIMSRQVGVSPVTVIVALLVGGDLLGIIGVILAVPTAAILQVIAGELFPPRERVPRRT